jgi:hypothetical protein
MFCYATVRTSNPSYLEFAEDAHSKCVLRATFRGREIIARVKVAAFQADPKVARLTHSRDAPPQSE